MGDTAATKHAATVLQFVRSPTGDAIAGSPALSPVIGGSWRRCALVPVQEHDQTVRIAIWQRPQQHSIDHGEDGRRRPDAEGQGEKRDAAECRLEPQRATGVARILKQ